ncbi:hypothetical protein Nepgr_000191 [Nepenthes gracilis]|uniref:Fe2OG dioxygenase domain-containing protein n=1 Tax=Nepenthes gracilis TaxID=150966 RepID=A0AAD3RVC3_NEPGR|nr:hypothetical protein Nepgr_000191 [Nepenthes gracilis]
MSETNLASYPPLFRTIMDEPTGRVCPEDDRADTEDRSMPEPDPLPEIDAEFLVPQKLGEACREWGIFRLVNHGIPKQLLRDVEEHAERMFDMQFESKKALFGGGPLSYFWGTPALTPSGVALPRGHQNIDWVEGLNVPLSQLSNFHTQDPFVSSFRKLMEEWGRHLTRLGGTLFEAMLNSLKLEAQVHRHHHLHYQKNYIDESTGIVRVYRYPRCLAAEAADRVKGLDAHTDSSVLSILYQNQVAGLQILKDDKWLQVNSTADSLIVNLGDMMQAMSDDEYRSVRHRVKLNLRKERISICYFVFPKEQCLIRSSSYKPFTYKDFRDQVQNDVATLGTKVGLPRFKLPQPPL